MTRTTRSAKQQLRKGSPTMLPTESFGWNGLQALKSSLSGRLAGFTRNRAPQSGPQKWLNDAAFFEADLRYIFKATPVIVDLSDQDYGDMDQMAQDLLVSLDHMVNGDLIKPLEEPNRQESKWSESRPPGHSRPARHDIAILSDKYPRLGALISFLDTGPVQFNLTTGPGSLLFTPPQGRAGIIAMDRVTKWKAFLERLAAGIQKSQSIQFNSLQQAEWLAKESTQYQLDVLQKRASVVVDAIFKEFRQLNCGVTHEIKLRVPDEWHTSHRLPALDMFVSCCPDGSVWQEAQCGSFRVTIDVAEKDSMCAAIQRARERRRKLHVFVDQQGLFDISDKMPLISSSLGNFAEDSLSELLNQKAFSRITLRDYREGVANERFSSGEKALLALALARCLMDFFDEELELASYSWKPERIYFPRSSYAHASSRVLYISLRPKLSGPKSPDLLKGVEPGNPVLLSFARLLLEIDSGEEIPMEIHPESRANVSKWAEMCAFVHEAEREGFSNYLRAVEGCLYLHLALPRSQNQATSSAASEVLRKVIYEQIVRNLELVVNPQSSKRRRRDSASELPQTKKLSISQPPDTDSREVLLVSPEITAAPIPSPLRRQFVSCNRPDSSTQPPKLAIRQNIELPTEIQKRLLCVKDSSEDTVVIEQQLVSMKSVEELEEAFSFSLYDEQGEENASNRPKAKTYFDRLERIKRRFIRPLAHKPTDKLPARLRQAIKIAIIDSGIDMTDPLVMGGALRIREKRNWTDSDPENWHDTYGHGTHVARLVIKVAPAAEIYIARVSTQKQIDANDTHLIAAAIDWATMKWGVDIISMSLGLNEKDPEIEKALDKVLNPWHGKPKRIVIAAAANWGGNQAIAYPARREGVICIHATDGFGNPSSTNPTVREGVNFAVVGLSIESTTMVKPKENPAAGVPTESHPKRERVYISGTSYATPIAAGIAANVLEFARHNITLSEGERELLYSSWGMSLIFQEMCEKRMGYDYVFPWKIFDDKLTDEEISGIIQGVLNGLKRQGI